jgi:hypothetical protein
VQEDKMMLKSSERLTAFAILYLTYSLQQSSANPFVALFINVSSGIRACVTEDYYDRM